MTVLEMALARQRELLWGLLGVAAITLVFRFLLPGERRSMRVTWVVTGLSLAVLGVVTRLEDYPAFAATAMAVAVVLWGLAAIHLGATVVFRGLLPLLGLNAPRIAHDLTFTALSLAWGLVWLRLGGVDPSQLFATSAVITAVLAFSMQDTLGNVLGGVTLQLDNSLRVGDWVRMEDVSGCVTDVHWRYTVIETRNRELVIIPNSWLMKNRFTVMRAPVDAPFAWRRGVQFNIDPNADPAAVIHALEHAVLDAEIPYVLANPPPNAILSEVASGYCRYVLRYWLGDPRQDDPGDSAVRVHALAALGRAGIRPGVPQEEHLMIKENDSWRASLGLQDSERRLDAIRRTELFAQLPAEEQVTLAGHLVHAPFAAGDIITRQGAVAHWLYLIIRGEARVLVDGPEGRLPVATLHDGDIFGEMGMLTGEARSATVIAATSVDCYRLDKEGFAKVLEARPEIAKEMTAIVEARNTERNALLTRAGASTVGRGDLLDRIRSFFSLRG